MNYQNVTKFIHISSAMTISKFLVASKTLKSCIQKFVTAKDLCRKPPTKFNVAILDAANSTGQLVALLLKQNPMVRELRLYDDKEILGIGMDLSDIDTSAKVTVCSGENNLKDAIEGADVVVNCGGNSPTPFDSYDDLFERNAENIRRTAIFLSEFNREAIFCVAKPPVESLVPMVYTEYKIAGMENPEMKIIGVINYCAMRANYWIAKVMKVDAFQISSPIIGGNSPDTAIAVVSGTKAGSNITNPRTYAEIQDGMAYGEEKILSIKIHEDGGPVSAAPAVGLYRLINNVLKGLRGDYSSYDCAFVRQEGHMKKFLPYMSSIVRFGRHGVYSTHMPNVIGGEFHRLKNSRPIMNTYIHLGESYITGMPKPVSLQNKFCAVSCDVSAPRTVQDVNEPYKVVIQDLQPKDKCSLNKKTEKIGNCKTC